MASKPSQYRPPPTSFHAAVGVGDKIYRWGGKGSEERRNMVDVFDISKQQWECLTTRGVGPPSPGIMECAYTAIGTSLFAFGGDDGHSHYNCLHELDTKTLEWRELKPQNINPSDGPQKKRGCGMVSLDEDKLVVFAGYTKHDKWTDELHVFDKKKKTWSSQPTTGTKPPPLTSFTFTKIDATRAVAFGGENGKNRYNDVYILDMRNWHWSLLDISSGPKPSVRACHAACCLSGPLTSTRQAQHPLVVVVGGMGITVLNDIWLLDIDGKRWKQVALPEAMLPRMTHTATAGPECRQLVLWGGIEKHGVDPIGETTLLNFDLNGGEWKVTSVVKENQLGREDEQASITSVVKGNQLGREDEQATITSVMEGNQLGREDEQAMVTSVVKGNQLGREDEQATVTSVVKGNQLGREDEQATVTSVVKGNQLGREDEQATDIREQEENMKAAEVLKKTNASPQSVPPDSTVPRRGDKPKFHHLKLLKGKDGSTIRVIKTVAAKWDDLAYSLYFERNVVNTIQRDNPQYSESACEEVLDKWSGDPTTRQPVTWATLIESLRDCEQNSLAEDLEKALY